MVRTVTLLLSTLPYPGVEAQALAGLVSRGLWLRLTCRGWLRLFAYGESLTSVAGPGHQVSAGLVLC